jgi:hypothetical protein
MGILLGIAQELGVSVKGLVSLPVAAVRENQEAATLLHVDLHLHRVEICRLTQSDRIRVEETHVISEEGLDPLLTQATKRVADEFVRSTRFDPLHDATTEQQLYTHIYRLLGRRDPGESSSVEITTGRTAHSLLVLPQMLAEAAADLRSRMEEGVERLAGPATGGVSVQLSHRARLVPGLRRALEQRLGLPVEDLPAGAAALGVRAVLDPGGASEDSQGVAFLNSRSCSGHAQSPPPFPVPTAVEERPAPTHLLCGHRAVAIGSQPLVVGSTPGGVSEAWPVLAGAPGVAERHCLVQVVDGRCNLSAETDAPVLLDGKRVEGTVTLAAGQCIQIGTPPVELQSILVDPEHGP